MKRALLTIVLLLTAAMAEAEVRLHIGEEFVVGVPELGPWPGFDARPVLASDGDRVLVAWAGNPVNQMPYAYAMLLDRDGRPVLPEPLFLGPATSEGLHAVWVNGSFVIFYTHSIAGFRAVRISRDGAIVETRSLTILPEAPGFPLDVATDGEEIALISWNKLLRLRSDLSWIETLDLGVLTGGGRAVAWGGGRFILVMTGVREVKVRFLERGLLNRGTLTGAVRVAGTSSGDQTADVAWTGSRFVAAWSECLDGRCVGSWTPLASDGSAAAPPVTTGHVLWEVLDHTVDVTPLGDEAVFLHWPADRREKAHGRRFRMNGSAIDAAPLELGRGYPASLLTAQGLLLTVDGGLQFSVTPAPAVAALANPLPRVPLLETAANELILGAAASDSEIAVLRTSHRTLFPDGGAVATVMTRDGTRVRDIALQAREAALASDGREIAMLAVDREGVLWFQQLDDPARRIRTGAGSYPAEVNLVWNGSEYVALWHEQTGIRMQRIAANGTLLEAAHAVEGMVGIRPQLVRAGTGLLAGWSDPEYPHGLNALRLTSSGVPAGPVERLASASRMALASNGRTDIAAAFGYSSRDEIALALREEGAPFQFTGTVLPVGDHRSPRDPVVAAAGAWFVALYETELDLGGPRLGRTNAALIDGRGVVVDAKVLDEGRTPYQALTKLVPLDDRTLLAVYTRRIPEMPYAGMLATCARVLVVSEGRRRAVGR